MKRKGKHNLTVMLLSMSHPLGEVKLAGPVQPKDRVKVARRPQQNPVNNKHIQCMHVYMYTCITSEKKTTAKKIGRKLRKICING